MRGVVLAMGDGSVPLFVVVPLACAFVVYAVGKRVKWLPDVLANLGAAALMALSVATLATLPKGGTLAYSVGGWAAPIGIAMVVDALTCLMLVVVNAVAFAVTVYSISYMERYTSKAYFYALFMLMLAGMNGLIVSGDLFNVFVFLEIASVASYALVGFGTEQEELEASFKYMVMGSIASTLILLAIAFLYSRTSTLNMADMARVLREGQQPKLVGFVSVLLLAGLGLKAALVPFHWWLPDAHPSAPAPISAMLSGLLIKALGIYALVRVLFSVLGGGQFLPVLRVLGAVSMVVGVFLAIGQWDYKRLLAYHSISQVGYIVLGIGMGTELGMLGGLFHLLNHSVFKSLLFLTSGAVDYATGTRDLQQLGGLRQRMPVTGNTSLVASMSIAGIPPFNGFWSKLIIVIACVQAGHPVYAMWAVLASIMTLASFMKVQKYAFFGHLRERFADLREVPLPMRVSMVVLALVCAGGGLLLVPGVREVLLDAPVAVLMQGTGYAEAVLGAIR